MLDLGSTGQEFDTHRRQGVVYLSKTLYPLLSSTGSIRKTEKRHDMAGTKSLVSTQTNKHV